MKKGRTVLKVITVLSFLLMIFVNVLAVVLPINGLTPGEVSEAYPNLFAPAGYTFSIWSIIYLLLAGYTLYQLGNYKDECKNELLMKVDLFFSISSIANAAWIFFWHNQLIPLTVIFMLIILICLIIIVNEIKKCKLTTIEKIFIKLPFSVYFGWITVATIANITVLLVSLGWNGFGIPEQVWAVIVIIIGLLISLATMLKNKDIAYGLVIIWAYIGILVKHLSPNGFDGQYPAVIYTIIVSIVLLVIGVIYLLVKRRKNHF